MTPVPVGCGSAWRKIAPLISPTLPRVVKPESDQMVETLRRLGREVEYVVFEDEGHDFSKRANQLKAYRLIAAFLFKHFGLPED